MAETMDFWKTLEIVMDRFPQWAPILQRAGIWDVLSKAINETWDSARIFTALQNTEYFKTTNDAERAWDVLKTTNPGEANRRQYESGRTTDLMIESLGVPLNPYEKARITAKAAENQWDENRIRAEIVATSSGATNLGPGGVGDKMTQFNGLAEDYGVHLNHNDAYWWAANAEVGNVSDEGYRNYLTQQATNLYPALAQPLAEGQSVRDFATSYLNQASSELGINPASISLLDPKWMGTFLGQNDKGEQTVLNMNESLQKIRTDPALGYDQGLPGRTQAAQVATMLREKMGLAA